MNAIPEGTRVEVRSGEAWFKGNIEESAWDLDQFVYKVSELPPSKEGQLLIPRTEQPPTLTD